MKIVINDCSGGFSLSAKALICYHDLTGISLPCQGRDVSRTDPDLIRVIEKLGQEAASGGFARLVIIELAAGTKYRIQEHDGLEWIETEADIEWSIA